MKAIAFYKLSGSGNDFIIIDNRENFFDKKNISKTVANICRRKMSVGADGLILVENSKCADFKWDFYNSDGSSAEMCGNGARCVARFAYLNKIADLKMSFETCAGVVSAEILEQGQIMVNMPDPCDFRPDFTIDLKSGSLSGLNSINTGVPHVIIHSENLEQADVLGIGREIRFHKMFASEGTNVNFISFNDDSSINIRTYERGVENETLACGTGSIAAALIAANKYSKKSPINVITKSSKMLTIHFKKEKEKLFDIYMEGDACLIYKGILFNDALKD